MRYLRLLFILSLIFVAGCWNPFQNPLDMLGIGGGGDDGPDARPDRVVEPTEKFALAVGGVASGRDELVIYDGGREMDFGDSTLECTAEEEDMLLIRPRPGFETEAAGSGVRMIAIEPGVTAVRCERDGEEMDAIYEVTVSPQLLIQILVAEASTQLDDEAELESIYDFSSDVVVLGSSSPTAEAIGSVVRNRVDKIENADNPSLFNADEELYDSDPPSSFYDAVIMADGQFSPTDSDDPTNDLFRDAQDRNFLDDEWLVVYDQAVFTAAGIYNMDIEDTTSGAFGFRSPTESEWENLEGSCSPAIYYIPDNSGYTENSFPAFSPIQVLIHPGVWHYNDGRPSFIFARERVEADPSVSCTP